MKCSTKKSIMNKQELENVKRTIVQAVNLLDEAENMTHKKAVKIVLECIRTTITKPSNDNPLQSDNTEGEKKLIQLLVDLESKL